MYKNFSIFAFIGARGGSKGLKNKNSALFSKKPLIHWTIEAARQSKYIDRVIVSTDSAKIAEISKQAKADVPFLRPQYLSKDRSSISDAVEHCIQWLEKKERKSYHFILRLQPTTPLRFTTHIDDAIEYYFKHRKSDEDTLVSVVNAPQKTGWIMKKIHPSYIDFCFDVSRQNPQRQDLPELFFPNGALFFSPLKKNKKTLFFTKRTLFYKMKPIHSVDIDTLEDFNLALRYLKEIQRTQNYL